MKIIALEGIDKCGKHTQTNLLVERLKREGYRVAQSEFHRYDTPTGELIQRWLRGEYLVSQLTIELLMTADKQAQQDWINELESDGYDYLVLDRYTTSQLIYAMCAGVPETWTKKLQTYMRMPDIEVYIDISPETSVARKGKHGDNDKYESNLKYLSDVRNAYLAYADTHDVIVVNGEQSVDVIHEQIFWGCINRAMFKSLAPKARKVKWDDDGTILLDRNNPLDREWYEDNKE